jgi:hypothetical protein
MGKIRRRRSVNSRCATPVTVKKSSRFIRGASDARVGARNRRMATPRVDGGAEPLGLQWGTREHAFDARQA